jgi:hypothetical protein
MTAMVLLMLLFYISGARVKKLIDMLENNYFIQSVLFSGIFTISMMRTVQQK